MAIVYRDSAGWMAAVLKLPLAPDEYLDASALGYGVKELRGSAWHPHRIINAIWCDEL